MQKLKSKSYIEDNLSPRVSAVTAGNLTIREPLEGAQERVYTYALTLRPTLSRLIKEASTCTQPFLHTKLLDICNKWNFDIISYVIEKDNHLHATLTRSDKTAVSFIKINSDNRGWHCFFKRLARESDKAAWEDYIMKDQYHQYAFQDTI